MCSLHYEDAQYPYSSQGAEVTVLEPFPTKAMVAVGYSSGTIRIFSYTSGGAVRSSSGSSDTSSYLPTITFRGHSASVLCLAFSSVSEPSSADHPAAAAVLLASGGADGDIVLWDLLAHSAVCRLRGHRDAVTAVAFLTLPARAPLSPAAAHCDSGAGSKLPSGQTQKPLGIGITSLLISASKDTLLKVRNNYT